MANVNKYDEAVGLLKVGTISDKGYSPLTGTVFVQLDKGVATSSNTPIEVYIPISLFDNDGTAIGNIPTPGTQVVVAQESGGRHYFVSFLTRNSDNLPIFKSGELLIQKNDSTRITLDKNNDINIGSFNNRLHINSSDNLLSSNFYNNYNFTQAARQVNGLIKRDKKRNTQFPQSLKLDDDIYDKLFSTVGMDPSASTNISTIGSKKNPPFVENRELIYEFQYSSNVKNELLESSLYGNKQLAPQDTNFINRRQCRADTLSLTLLEPNYLLETIKGTVVDIFGNILDLNRAPLTVGQGQNTIRPDKSSDKEKSYLQIRELERRSLAYHFELNARKDLTGSNGQLVLPDINSNDDHARNRSRFFIDIDKEGQFKINVPASSEKGNIPLLTRYENFSSFYVDADGTTNPNKLIYRDDNLDIFQDSFAAPFDAKWTSPDFRSTNRGSINIKDGDSAGTPTDRITGSPIKHGTAYHDILSTCYALIGTDFLNYQNNTQAPYKNIDIDYIAEYNSNLTNIANNTINISGTNANAGGRSGSINLDGSLDLNIGANTIDRQSLWLDCAGGIVANVGRDLKNKSLAMNLDGDVFVQIGGYGVQTDNRFLLQNNSFHAGVLDIRVINGGFFTTMIRIDKNGVQVMSPGNIQVHGSQAVKITSDGSVDIQAPNVTIQGRLVLKESGGSI